MKMAHMEILRIYMHEISFCFVLLLSGGFQRWPCILFFFPAISSPCNSSIHID